MRRLDSDSHPDARPMGGALSGTLGHRRPVTFYLHSCDDHPGYASLRSAVTGSTRAARLAGISAASSPIGRHAAPPPRVNASGSSADTSNSRLFITLVSASAPARPTTSPTSTIVSGVAQHVRQHVAAPGRRAPCGSRSRAGAGSRRATARRRGPSAASSAAIAGERPDDPRRLASWPASVSCLTCAIVRTSPSGRRGSISRHRLADGRHRGRRLARACGRSA